MPPIAQPWLISKYARGIHRLLCFSADTDLSSLANHLGRFFDPIFAICVGTAAAAIRIRREQIAKYPDRENDFRRLWKKAQRMSKGYFTSYRDMEP